LRTALRRAVGPDEVHLGALALGRRHLQELLCRGLAVASPHARDAVGERAPERLCLALQLALEHLALAAVVEIALHQGHQRDPDHERCYELTCKPHAPKKFYRADG